jgi:hypothetical protein
MVIFALICARRRVPSERVQYIQRETPAVFVLAFPTSRIVRRIEHAKVWLCQASVHL